MSDILDASTFDEFNPPPSLVSSLPVGLPSSAFPNFDLSGILNGASVPLVQAPVSIAPAPGGGFLSNLNDLARNIVGGAQTFYQTQAQLEQAKAQAAIAKAQGRNAVQVASAGLPSPQLLLFGGFGLVALMLLTRRK